MVLGTRLRNIVFRFLGGVSLTGKNGLASDFVEKDEGIVKKSMIERVPL